MSKFLSDSRSPTPTPANPSQTSRRHIPEGSSPQDTQSSDLREESFGLRPIHQAESPKPDIPHTRPIRPIESSASDQRMAKRIRSSDVTSNSNSHSRSPQRLQDDVASSSTSNTTSMTQDAQSTAAVDIAPSKKKRTRTLTTPYQAAVLHGLLAQSRFPTTAKREEVGRLIGLSARKVQIWFQNQRQKARRPRSQSDPNTKHPQYGAFSSVPPPGPEYGVQPPFNTHPGADSLSLMQLPSGSSQSLHSAGTPVSTPDSYSSLPDAPLLLGPGVPGLDMHPRGTPLGSSSNISLPQIGQLDAHYPAAGSSRLIHQNSPPISPAPGHLLPRRLSVPSHLRDAYPTLPPLALGRASISPPGAPSEPLAGSQSYIDTSAQPVNMDRPFIHYRPASPRVIGTPISGSAVPGSIPPPYTLQPQPQWDRRSFTPSLTRPNIWSPPGSSRSSVSPTQPFFVPYARPPLVPSVSTPDSGRDDTTEPITEEINRNAQPSAPQKPPPHQSRAGRYDPVRAAVIPLTTPSPPHRSSPLPPSDREHMDGRC